MKNNSTEQFTLFILFILGLMILSIIGIGVVEGILNDKNQVKYLINYDL